MPQRNLLNQPLADGIRRLGFRKWYERELLSSHAHMTLAILAAVAMLASFEAFQGGSMADKLMDVVFVVVSGAIALWSLRRYLFLLMHAEEVANQANCPDCGTYARFEVVGEDRRSGHTEVRCRACTRVWTIEA